VSCVLSGNTGCSKSQSAAESIVSTMSDALLLVDGTGKIGAVNRALRKMTAYNENELVGRDVECVLEVAP